ncbi:MAG: 2-C-methyl-D-erythritol 4-phosphate cytidylyltransferase [Clostridia bacterium]|nr:2-C-methyl-D-erythritol 4-phosphate cytidylyltransferase [Clostridia bacterium]
MSFKDMIFKKDISSNKAKRCAALILAAGASSRMGLAAGQSKQFLMIGDKPMLGITLLAFERSPDISEIVVVARSEDFSVIRHIAKELSISKLKNIVAGGSTRSDSSLHGVLELSGRCEYIAVHDGARPFVTQKIIHETCSAAKTYGAAVPGFAPFDTVKEIGADGAVIKTLDRDKLRLIQTPQVFEYELLKKALLNVKEKNLKITDDASAVEALGHKVYITDGDRDNIKVTSAGDIAAAEHILKAKTDKKEWIYG